MRQILYSYIVLNIWIWLSDKELFQVRITKLFIIFLFSLSGGWANITQRLYVQFTECISKKFIQPCVNTTV